MPTGGIAPVTILFVPGLMGSALRFNGEGARKELRSYPVWDEDLSTILDILSSHPERLTGPLEVGRVLRRITAYGRTMTTLYGPLLDKLEAAAETQPGGRVVQFPYDWRRDIRSTMRHLEDVVRGLPDSMELCFVGHSLGCWVIRLLLASCIDLASRTRKFIQLAPPTLGSSTAYYSLRHSPEFRFVGSVAEWLRGMRSLVSSRPNLDARLRECISSFDTMYLLMPPKSELILANTSGEFFSAFDQRGWPELFHAKLSSAEQLQQVLQAFTFQRTITYYGTDISTERDYVIDERFIINAKLRAWISGDGTVTQASAVHNAPIGLRHPLANVAHHSVPSCPALLQDIGSLVTDAATA